MSPADEQSVIAPPHTAGAPGARALLANPNFRRLWLGEAVSQLGDGLTGLAILVLIHRLTGSTAALAAMAITAGIPQLLFGLHAGVVADRVDRRRLMIASDVLRGLAVLSLVLIRSPEHVPWLYAVGLFQATVGIVFEPAKAALLPLLVDPPSLLKANALSQTSRVSAGMAGAALAGALLMLPNGTTIAFGIDALSFWISAALIARITATTRPERTLEPSATGYGGQLLEGIRFLFKSRVLIGLFATFAITMLGLGAVNVLFIPFLVDELQASTAVVGLARGAQMVGMVLGGVAVGALVRGLAPGTLVVAGICGLGISLMTIGALHQAAAVVAVLAGIGVCSSAFQAGTATVLQQQVPDRLRGRLESALDTLLVLVMMLAMAATGLSGDAWGSRPVFFIAGTVVVIAGVAGGLIMRGSARPAPGSRLGDAQPS